MSRRAILETRLRLLGPLSSPSSAPSVQRIGLWSYESSHRPSFAIFTELQRIFVIVRSGVLSPARPLGLKVGKEGALMSNRLPLMRRCRALHLALVVYTCMVVEYMSVISLDSKPDSFVSFEPLCWHRVRLSKFHFRVRVWAFLHQNL